MIRKLWENYLYLRKNIYEEKELKNIDMESHSAGCQFPRKYVI